jgi:hypothetical protein
VFDLQGRGTVVTGRVEQGTIKTGEDVEILGLTQVLLFSPSAKGDASASLGALFLVLQQCSFLFGVDVISKHCARCKGWLRELI